VTDEEKTDTSASDPSSGDASSAPVQDPTPEPAPEGADLVPEATPIEVAAPMSDLVLAVGVPRLGVPVGAAELTPDIAPSFGFLAVVSLLSLIADLSTKVWAKERLEAFPGYVTVWEKHASFILAHNKGGAWGLLQSTNENVRKPFFLLVSAAAIAFIVTLFRRLQPNQRALKWGLPLVLGGALGNVFDRIRYGSVIDFIDVHGEWGGIDHHWPTFNVADIAICVGVGLMAIDMFTSKRRPEPIRRAAIVPVAASDAGATETAAATATETETETETATATETTAPAGTGTGTGTGTGMGEGSTASTDEK
jgi:lipoprotein signal peptidase